MTCRIAWRSARRAHDDSGTAFHDSSITTSTRPRSVAWTFSRTILAIDELHGDTLRICYDLSGAGRPADFGSAEGTQVFLVSCKRAAQPPR